MKFTTIFLLLSFVLLATLEPAYADSMRCGSRLVSTGDDKVKVLLRCGEPFHKEAVSTVETQESVATTSIVLSPEGVEVVETEKREAELRRVEKWYYSFGRTSFIRILTFEGEELVSVDTGDKP